MSGLPLFADGLGDHILHDALLCGVLVKRRHERHVESRRVVGVVISSSASFTSGFGTRRAALPWVARYWGTGSRIKMPPPSARLRWGAGVWYSSFTSCFGMY
jgi:hypothetical protein